MLWTVTEGQWERTTRRVSYPSTGRLRASADIAPSRLSRPSRYFCKFHQAKQNAGTRAYMQRRRAAANRSTIEALQKSGLIAVAKEGGVMNPTVW